MSIFKVNQTVAATSGAPAGKTISNTQEASSKENYNKIQKLAGNIPLSGGYKKSYKKKSRKNKKQEKIKKK